MPPTLGAPGDRTQPEVSSHQLAKKQPSTWVCKSHHGITQSVTMKWYGRRFEKTSAGGGTFFFFKAVMEESRPAVLPKGCGLVWPTKFSRAPGFL